MILAKANLTAETRVLSMTVTALTFQILSLNHLATGLVLKLIIFTEELETEAACETSSSVVPHSSLTLHTLRISENTATGVTLQTLLAMTNPGFTEITNGSNHLSIKETRIYPKMVLLVHDT